MNCHRFATPGNNIAALSVLFTLMTCAASAQFDFGPEQLVQAGGADIEVPGYSVPSFVDWNNDGLCDLIVGEGSGGYPAKVRIYLNEGTPSAPAFADYLYAQSGNEDLICEGSGCLGLFPRVVYWNDDDLKDLLIGQADGTIMIFLNVGADPAPVFDAGTYLQVGETGSKIDIDIGARATPIAVDWNNDGKKDLVVGSLNGTVSVFVNVGTDTEPDFLEEVFTEAWGYPLSVPSSRSSPIVADLDGDGAKDLLCGNTNGNLIFFNNVATDDAPAFEDFIFVEADGEMIDLVGSARSRPSLCDFNGDDLPDVLIGANDGKIHLYQTVEPVFGDVTGDGVVDQQDIAFVAALWGDTSGGAADINQDGIVDVIDLLLVLAHWS